MNSGATGRAAGRQRGLALLLTVWLLTLLAVVAGEFVASGRVKAAAESNKRDDLRGLALAQAGYRAALQALDGVTALTVDEQDRLLLTYQDSADEVPAAEDDVPLGDGVYSWRISDESGLVDLNSEKRRNVLAKLLQQCGLEAGAERDTIIDSVFDWSDTNRDHRLNGAEEDYYRALDPPYSCKDGPFDVVEELLLVRGVTPELFFGKVEDGKRRPGLRDLVTTQPVGQPNPGTAPRAVVEALGLTRPPQATPARPMGYFRITATGKPAGGAPARQLQAVVQWTEADDSRPFALVYWNDTLAWGEQGRADH